MVNQYKTRDLFLFPILAVILRLLFLLYIGLDQPMLKFSTFDSQGYILPAMNMLNYGVFSSSEQQPLTPEIMRTPGYPWFLALSFLLFGQKPIPIIISQAILGGLTVLITYMICAELGLSKRAGWIAAFLILIDPVSIQLGNRILTETIFTTVHIGSLLLFVSYLKQQRLYYYFISALLLSLAALTRPIAQYLPLVLVPVFFLSKSNLTWPRKTVMAVIFIFISILPTTAWAFRNYREAGVFTLSNVSNLTLLDYRARPVLASAEEISQEEASSRLEEIINQTAVEKDLTDDQVVALQGKIALGVFRKYPGETIKMIVKGTAFMLFDPGYTITCSLLDRTSVKFECFPGRSTILNSNPIKQAIDGFNSMTFVQKFTLIWGLLFLGVVYIGVLAGVVYLVRQRNWFVLYFTIICIFYFVVLSGGGDINYRFRVPFVPFLVILAGFGYNCLFTTPWMKKTTDFILKIIPGSHRLRLVNQ
jgi:4-amino-4-deoxy-L-arabinose transferase-like glycosyltransferase